MLAHGASAPSPIDSDGSGTTSSGSISICEPSPVQRGHAPCGELKEKIRGSSSGIDRPVVGAGELLGVQRDRLARRPRCGTVSISTIPSASATAVSIESARRLRRSPRMTRRSTTIEMSCLYFLSSTISSSSIRSSPSTFAREKPSARSSSRTLPYSPLRPRTSGASTMKRVPSVELHDLVDDLLGRLPGDRLAADVAVRMADARPQQAQVVVDLGDRADRRPRVARRRLLVDRDRRRQALDRVDVGLVHLAEELPRVGAQRLDVAALALGVDRVEGERGLARPRQPRDDHERVARERERDVLEVVLAGAGDDDRVAWRHCNAV